jgi:hypothetical protein
MLAAYTLMCLILAGRTRAFVLQPESLLRNQQAVQLFSTVSPRTPDVNIGQEDNRPPKGAISMNIDELAEALGGRGRAQLAWDCYKAGIDPALADFETIWEVLPTCRRGKTLGKEAIESLAKLCPNGGRLDGGVASLSHVTQSNDKTTKLLLRLSDGMEVETVIIPWSGNRSTLCISSQVGCRQG